MDLSERIQHLRRLTGGDDAALAALLNVSVEELRAKLLDPASPDPSGGGGGAGNAGGGFYTDSYSGDTRSPVAVDATFEIPMFPEEDAWTTDDHDWAFTSPDNNRIQLLTGAYLLGIVPDISKAGGEASGWTGGVTMQLSIGGFTNAVRPRPLIPVLPSGDLPSVLPTATGFVIVTGASLEGTLQVINSTDRAITADCSITVVRLA